MVTAYVVAVQVAGLALAVAGVVRAGDRPQVLLYAFILEYALRLATVFAVVRALAARDDSLLGRLAPIVALVYWVQSLLDRTTIVDANARWDVNVGYNTRELTILAVSVLVAGLAVVVRQANDLPASGWTVLGPLFAFRFLYDLWGALPRKPPAPSNSASSSRRRE